MQQPCATTYEFCSLINPKVSSKEVIVFVLKNTQAEILCIQNVELSFVAQVTGFVLGPVGLGGNAGLQVFDNFLSESVTRQHWGHGPKYSLGTW